MGVGGAVTGVEICRMYKGSIKEQQNRKTSLRGRKVLRGTVIEYDHLRNIIREMVVALGLPKNKFAVTPHGLRISATSTAYIQGIACLVMCRYVEWSVSTLGITHAQYVQVTDDKLATVPFDMLH